MIGTRYDGSEFLLGAVEHFGGILVSSTAEVSAARSFTKTVGIRGRRGQTLPQDADVDVKAELFIDDL